MIGRDDDRNKHHLNGLYFDGPGPLRDGYEDRVPNSRAGIDRARLEALRALEWRRFRCDEIPVRES